ncbi:MAG: hypothetical protein A3J63_03915 [Candidatus Moranbacteria bacterium RIFCSPHIGHO2_02_FULL_40_12b]|nr:MAG: hypothetical protein A3J63_03915 [Candidatus Moranbacteria bacterium RIFCSPHIGHO2_02_FULL_40_12b]OGI23138.1 MAG: hypothetical protein A3E91_00120 [Candidatus Moranbacteria bacterium RIFCSPHIGHO2_12_FULL_40_10]
MGAGPERHHRIDLLNDLKNLYDLIGRRPKSSDIDFFHEKGLCVTSQRYRDRFGSIKNAVDEMEKEFGCKKQEQLF